MWVLSKAFGPCYLSSISGGYKPYGPGDLKDEDLPKNGSEGNGTTNNRGPGGKPGAASSMNGGAVMASIVAGLVAVMML